MYTDEQVRAIAKEAAEEAVKDVFLVMGINVRSEDAIITMQKDFVHLRESREGKEEFIKKGKLTLIGIFVTAAIGLLIKGLWAEVATAFSKAAVGG